MFPLVQEVIECVSDKTKGPSWNAFKRRGLRNLFLGVEDRGINSPCTLTKLSLFIQEFMSMLDEKCFHSGWEKEVKPELMEELHEVRDPIEFAIFIVDIKTQLSQMTSNEEGHAFDCVEDMHQEVTTIAEKLEKSGEDVDRYMKNAGRAKIFGGGVGILGGILVLSGVIAAPFTAGASLSLTGAGVAVGAAGGATTFGATVLAKIFERNGLRAVDASDIIRDIYCISYAIEMFMSGYEVCEDFFKTSKRGLQVIQELLEIINSPDTKTPEYSLGSVDMKIADIVKVAIIVRMIRPELGHKFHADLAKPALAKGIKVPGWIIQYTGSTSLSLVSSGAKLTKFMTVAGGIAGMVSGLLDIISGVKDATSKSESGKKLQKCAEDMRSAMESIEEFWMA